MQATWSGVRSNSRQGWLAEAPDLSKSLTEEKRFWDCTWKSEGESARCRAGWVLVTGASREMRVFLIMLERVLEVMSQERHRGKRMVFPDLVKYCVANFSLSKVLKK